MTYQPDRQAKRVADIAKRERLQITQFKADVVAALALPASRRVVWAFLQAMGVDGSPFNTNAMAQSRAVGMQDAARWWLNAIRDNCPEREPQMRAEAIKAAKQPQTTEETENDD